MTQLAGRIRKARLATCMSQSELATCLGVTRGAVANWECASAAVPASERLQRIAQATQVSFEWLATGRGPVRYLTEESPLAGVETIENASERRLLQALRSVPPVQHAKLILAVEAFALVLVSGAS